MAALRVSVSVTVSLSLTHSAYVRVCLCSAFVPLRGVSVRPYTCGIGYQNWAPQHYVSASLFISFIAHFLLLYTHSIAHIACIFEFLFIITFSNALSLSLYAFVPLYIVYNVCTVYVAMFVQLFQWTCCILCTCSYANRFLFPSSLVLYTHFCLFARLFLFLFPFFFVCFTC